MYNAHVSSVKDGDGAGVCTSLLAWVRALCVCACN